jgi:N-acetylglucosamine-6-phosphate deacetylase
MLYIHGATIYTPHEQINDGALIVSNDRITTIGKSGEINIPKDAQIVDATGLVLAPGFIDMQINGGFGHYFTSDPDSIWEVAEELPRYGVTSFLPTIITSPLNIFSKAQNSFVHGNTNGNPGATPLGLHFEGSFLNPIKKGAHNQEYLCPPSMKAISTWSSDNGVRLVTLAPELPGGLEMVQRLTSQGVVVSAGHSMATFSEALAGLELGIRYGTHLFNAMRPLEHRQPGVVGALLGDPRCVVGIIPDGIHLDPAIVELISVVKGPDRLNLVTDAMAALGMPPGQYQINNREVTVTEIDARLPDGTLAGSIISLDEALRNYISFTQSPLNEALKTITSTPATILGMSDQRGRISPGNIADLVILNPDLEVIQTIVEGQVMYTNDSISIKSALV